MQGLEGAHPGGHKGRRRTSLFPTTVEVFRVGFALVAPRNIAKVFLRGYILWSKTRAGLCSAPEGIIHSYGHVGHGDSRAAMLMEPIEGGLWKVASVLGFR